MKMILIALLQFFAVTGGGATLNLTSSLESKLNMDSHIAAGYLRYHLKLSNEFRWLASIIRQDRGTGEILPRCIGIIISPVTIVLPAYCVYNLEQKTPYKLIKAEINSKDYSILRCRKHPEYFRGNPDAKYFDIAVASLFDDTKLGGAVLPQPHRVFWPQNGALLFGMTSSNHINNLVIRVNTLDVQECFDRLNNATNLKLEHKKNFICAEKVTLGVTLTESDVGSPVAQRYIIIGFISGEFYDKVPNIIILTNIFEHLDFIEGERQKSIEVMAKILMNIAKPDCDTDSVKSEESVA